MSMERGGGEGGGGGRDSLCLPPLWTRHWCCLCIYFLIYLLFVCVCVCMCMCMFIYVFIYLLMFLFRRCGQESSTGSPEEMHLCRSVCPRQVCLYKWGKQKEKKKCTYAAAYAPARFVCRCMCGLCPPMSCPPSRLLYPSSSLSSACVSLVI